MSNPLDHHCPAPYPVHWDAAPELEPEVERQALRASAIRQARRLVEFYRITVEELAGDGASPGDSASQFPSEGPTGSQPGLGAPIGASAHALPPKYRHPVTGETWDGQGAHPDWMRQALLKDGYRVAELRVVDPTQF